ncbi:hypothetical protein H632_c4746p0, partial [Helicosporidium sp. ATCC 50920]
GGRAARRARASLPRRSRRAADERAAGAAPDSVVQEPLQGRAVRAPARLPHEGVRRGRPVPGRVHGLGGARGPQVSQPRLRGRRAAAPAQLHARQRAGHALQRAPERRGTPSRQPHLLLGASRGRRRPVSGAPRGAVPGRGLRVLCAPAVAAAGRPGRGLSRGQLAERLRALHRHRQRGALPALLAHGALLHPVPAPLPRALHGRRVRLAAPRGARAHRGVRRGRLCARGRGGAPAGARPGLGGGAGL